MKKFAIGLLVLILIIGGGLYFLYANLGSIVKVAVEKYGSEATQASVKLTGVKIDIPGGAGSISGFKVGNPTGFSTPSAMQLQEIAIAFDTNSITADGPIIVREITIDQPFVTYERVGAASNLQTIQKNVTDYANALGGGGGGSSSSTSSKPSRKMIIKDLLIRQGQISISHSALKGRELKATLPTIHLKNIGQDKGGATPAEVIEQVLVAITSSASKIGAKELVSAVGSLGGVIGDGELVDPVGTGKKLKGLLGQ